MHQTALDSHLTWSLWSHELRHLSLQIKWCCYPSAHPRNAAIHSHLFLYDPKLHGLVTGKVPWVPMISWLPAPRP